MSAHFLVLPVETQRMVLEYVLHPADLQALCLVSKHVSELATEYLYRDLNLPYQETGQRWNRLQLVARSRRLHHVRTVTVGDSNFVDVIRCRPSLDAVIAGLPLNRVTRFRWNPNGRRPSLEGLRQLWRDQRYLTNLQLDFSLNAPSMADIVSEEDARTIRSLNRVTELTLILGGDFHYPPERYEKMVNLLVTPKLRRLDLSANIDDPIDDDLIDDDPIEQLWTPLLSILLTSVDLSYLSLSAAAMSCLDGCLLLKHLRLNKCLYICDSLDKFTNPRLESLIVTFRTWSAFEEDLAAVFRFLLCFQSLRRLVLDAYSQRQKCNESDISDLSASIGNHSANLHSLFIDILPPDSPSAPFAGLALECKELRQLAIRVEAQAPEILCNALTSGFPKLTTLNLFKFTTPPGDCGFELLAKKVFAGLSHSSRLSILAFGEKHHYGDGLYRYSQKARHVRYCFFKDRKALYDLNGKSGNAPVRIKASQARYVEPESDILDYAMT